MNLIRPSYEIIEQAPGLQGIYDIIEIAGKTSYKSPVKGGAEAKKFVDWRTKEKHGAVLEFGTVYLKVEIFQGEKIDPYQEKWNVVDFYEKNKFSVVNRYEKETDYSGPSGATISGKVMTFYITTNYRVIVENGREKDLELYLCDTPEIGTFTEPKHERRYCVRFILDRFTGEEFLRHRVFSFCRESTRYCNYSMEKFDNNITFIIPPWIPSTVLAEGKNVSWWDGDWVDMKDLSIVKYGGRDKDGKTKLDRIDIWLSALMDCESSYMTLTRYWEGEDVPEEERKQWQPQYARTLLPCAIKSPLVMCGFAHDFYHWFHLRALGTTGAPHPQAKELAEPLMKEFIERGYISREKLYESSGKYRRVRLPHNPERGEFLAFNESLGKWYDFVEDKVYDEGLVEFLDEDNNNEGSK